MKIHKEVPSSFSNSDLIIGDSAIVLKKLPDSFVDLTVTSPPYDNLREYKGYCFDFETIARELYRVTKEGGVVVWVVADATVDGSETGTSFRQALFFMQCGFKLHDTMIWNKGGWTATGALKTRYGSVFEYMLVFSKGKISVFNPLKDRKNKTAGSLLHSSVRCADGTTKEMCNAGKPIAEYGQRFNVWEIPAESSNSLRTSHPAPFPEALALDHILSWSNEGGLVLDCFSGSGTTAKMAQYVNRRFIGIEISEEYAVLSKNRAGDEQVMF